MLHVCSRLLQIFRRNPVEYVTLKYIVIRRKTEHLNCFWRNQRDLTCQVRSRDGIGRCRYEFTIDLFALTQRIFRVLQFRDVKERDDKLVVDRD